MVKLGIGHILPPRHSRGKASMTTGADWHAAFPQPRTDKAQLGVVTPDEMLALLRAKAQDYVLIDVRRNDHEGGAVRGSINLPAQSLYPTIPRLYRLFKDAGVKDVIWYCGSSGGRGTRTAAWFADHIQDQGDGEMRSKILQGGIKAWARGGDEFVQWMDGYDAAVWAQGPAGGCN